MSHIKKPIVYRLSYNQDDLNSMTFEDEKSKEYILDYPIIYIIDDQDGKKFDVYVGESSNIRQRTLQHLKIDSKSLSYWKKLSESDNAEMYVIGHEHFNKSLTLDIENKMMLYLSGVPDVKKIYNRRTNAQYKYYTSDEVDIVLIDEAHLLLTQGKQSYRGENQLSDILERSRITIAVFDRNQILNTEQYWEENQLREYEQQALESKSLLHLDNQLRIRADKATVFWLRNMIDNQIINEIPKDRKGYDLKVFDRLPKMYDAILEKSNSEDSALSRMVATFDWEYNGNKSPENSDYWYVSEGDFSLPWNLQLSEESSRNFKNHSWAEQPQTIGEVGSTFTIQGFDLNYVGVIIGPSVKYREGKIIFDKNASKNKKAIRNRTLQDKSKGNFAEKFIQNELNVLLTRGVNGLYIYAVDPELRRALLKAQNGVPY